MMDLLHEHSAYHFIPYLDDNASTEATELHIRHTSTWTYTGPLLTPSTLPPSFHAWSTHLTWSPLTIVSRLVPVLSFLHTFLPSTGIKHYWLTVRATQPTTEYDVPRWHVDDDFFALPRDDGSNHGNHPLVINPTTGWKLCTTLLGPGTLFLRPSSNAAGLQTLRSVKDQEIERRGPHVCTSIRCQGCFDAGASVRSLLATSFADEETVQPSPGEVVLFRTGEGCGAVHSEPRCHVERIFVNVVPGTEEELRGLSKRFGMGWPRAWTLGVPGGVVGADEM